jgi:anti-sigma factor RsiW
MTCEECTALFGDAVDGTLEPHRSAEMETHCSGCASCASLLQDLMEIRAAAAALPHVAAPRRVWDAISAQVEHPGSMRRRPAMSGVRWETLAAAAGLLLMVGLAAWVALGPGWRPAREDAAGIARNAANELQLAEQHYLNAISSLEQLTADRSAALDPAVAAEIAESLQSIDMAIADSRAALKAEPESFVAQTSLLEALRMKVAVLQETVSLMNARS